MALSNELFSLDKKYFEIYHGWDIITKMLFIYKSKVDLKKEFSRMKDSDVSSFVKNNQLTEKFTQN